jgi:uncharacterized protein YprB with RNaseH-like and TPR domain
MDESLLDKLKSLGVQIGADKVKPQSRQKHAAFPIESVLDGKDTDTIYGPAFHTHARFAPDHHHGQICLCADCATETLALYSGADRIRQPGRRNVLFLDTETSGLAGGTGTYAFMIGVGYRTDEGFELLQFFMRDPSQEPAILAALDELAAHFDVIVTFNGKSFDIPLLNTRYTLNGLTPPFEPFQHIDLLHLARKLWRDRLPSRALGELENAILNVDRTRDDVPGWMIPELYFEYLRSGDARPLANVFYHNSIDILSLAALYNHVAGLLNDPLQTAADSGFDLAAIARLYEEMGRIEEAAQLYASSLDRGDLPEEFFFKTIERYALLRRRHGEWDKAVQLWRQAAEHGELFACIELSKYYEHRERNYTEALRWANLAYQTLKERYFWEQAGRSVEKEIERRIGRLTQRVYRSYE